MTTHLNCEIPYIWRSFAIFYNSPRDSCNWPTKVSQYCFKSLYLNFEDDRLVELELSDFQKLVEVFMELFGKQTTFYFDEIQNIPQWERFIRRLYNEGKKVFLTGSNADLFSRELGTRLTGRYISIEAYPLSFFEVTRNLHSNLLYDDTCLDSADLNFESQRQIKTTYTTKQKGILLHLFAQYQETGGIPEFRVHKHPKYLHSLYESIIYRDIMARYKITNASSEKGLFY